MSQAAINDTSEHTEITTWHDCNADYTEML